MESCDGSCSGIPLDDAALQVMRDIACPYRPFGQHRKQSAACITIARNAHPNSRQQINNFISNGVHHKNDVEATIARFRVLCAQCPLNGICEL